MRIIHPPPNTSWGVAWWTRAFDQDLCPVILKPVGLTPHRHDFFVGAILSYCPPPDAAHRAADGV